MDAVDEWDVEFDTDDLGVVSSQDLIDQCCLHVNSFQFEQLFTQDEMKGIIILTSKSILADDQNHVCL